MADFMIPEGVEFIVNETPSLGWAPRQLCFRHAVIRAILRNENIIVKLSEHHNRRCMDCAHGVVIEGTREEIARSIQRDA
jgi:hypothetical protein